MASFRSTIVVAVALVLAGCAGVVPRGGVELSEVRSPYIADAEAALALGDPASALTLLRMAAAEAGQPAATGLRMEAALLALELDDPASARRALSSRYSDANPSNRLLGNLLRVRLGDLSGPAARTALSVDVAALPSRLVPFHLRARARLAETAGDLDAALDHRIAIARTAPPAFLARRNEAALWTTLSRMPLPALRERAAAADTSVQAGWQRLALLTRERGLMPDGAARAYSEWRDAHPRHPASQLLGTRIAAMQRADLSPPRKIAVLLPVTGELGAAGRRIRQGILAAHHAAADNRRRPQLLFIDTGEQGLPAPAAYRRAQAEQAAHVIGPLDKRALRDLLASTQIDIPVLALNRLDDMEAPPNVQQFGLAPEDDARAAAALALQLGHRQMTALGSANDWGRRVVAAFTDEFEAGGGQVLERGTYSADQQDMSGPIRRLFNLDLSVARHERIRSASGLRLRFEDRRRADMEAIFLAAFEASARLAAPQIRFQRGIGLPVLATTQAYPETADDSASQDLDALMITRMPWLFGIDSRVDIQRARAQLEAAGSRTPRRLHALGIDAYQLLGPLSVLEREPTLRAMGTTGAIRVDASGRVHRHLLPARIGRSGPERLRLSDTGGAPEYLP